MNTLTVDEINLSSPELWENYDIYEIFDVLRRERPLSFHPEPDIELDYIPKGNGYWAFTKYEDIVFASRHPELFISGKGSNIVDLPEDLNEFLGSMINMDAPKHTKLRGLVNRGFTPRAVARVEETVHRVARDIVKRVAGMGECDFVTEIAAALPLKIICDMMGIPESDYGLIFEKTNRVLGGFDEEYGGSPDAAFQAGWELQRYGLELAEERARNPRDDITTQLVEAEVDGHKLSPADFGSFFVLLVVAGNETTRNAISHGMKALTDHPDQKKIWTEDFDAVAGTAVEEIVRWATPVIHFRRTATEDVVLRDTTIKAEDKVVLWYTSGNRDEDVFEDPYLFDVRRSPNEHIAFGAGGPHFCLGAHLARREIRVMFEEIFRWLPDLEITGEPELLRSAFIHGIKHMPCRFTPRKIDD